MTKGPDDPQRYLGNGVAPDRNPTDEERLLAEVVNLNDRIPVGLQIGLSQHLESAMKMVNTLFTKHNLPHRDALLDELSLWQKHAEQAMTFSRRCDELMTELIRHADHAAELTQLHRQPPWLKRVDLHGNQDFS